jgi:hypothetical protein
MDGMDETNYQKLAAEQLEAWLDDLYQKAETIVESHWSVVRANEQKMPGWENKSALQLRCSRKGNAIKIEWTKIRWVGSKAKGTRRSIREYIKRGKGYGYSLKTLLAVSRAWEKPLVEQTERKLAAIRREAGHVNKSLQYIRFAMDARKEAMAENKNGYQD